MARILVTGGAGFIGSHFVDYRHARHPHDMIVVVDALTYAGDKSNIQSLGSDRIEFVHGDIGNESLLSEIIASRDIDTVVNFAAETHVDRSISGPDIFVETNVLGTHKLLKVCRKVWSESSEGFAGKRFHHVSTDEVYGSLELDEPAFTEATPYRPNSPYSASKASADHFVRAYHETYGLPITISNCSNNYGPRQYPEKLIPLAILNACNSRPIGIYGKGENVRDWLHVEDHCNAIEVILQRGVPGRTYNVGGRAEVRNIDLVKLLCRLLDERRPRAGGASHEELIEFVTDRPGHDLRYAIDQDRIESELGWIPAHTLESGLRETVDWYLEHMAWMHSMAEKARVIR